MAETPAARGLTVEHLEARLDVAYNWGYEQTRKDLRDLYTKAKHSQWIPETTLAWSTDVDPEKPWSPPHMFPLFGSDIYAKLSEKELAELNVEVGAWTLSQFMHGEQGALLAATQLVAAVPDYDSKLYGATQVVDEARHVEVYDRYLHEKIGFQYPINTHLKTLLDLILKDTRWDMKFLGMQIMVEGLALAAYAMMRNNTSEPLLKELTAYLMGDEARHVAFGVLSLRDHYRELPEAEVREREDFVYEAARLMRDRFLFQEVWDKTGLPRERCMEITLASEPQKMFRQLLFAKIVPAVKKLGLLSDRQRERFQQLGILQFENWADPMDEVLEAPPKQAA